MLCHLALGVLPNLGGLGVEERYAVRGRTAVEVDELGAAGVLAGGFLLVSPDLSLDLLVLVLSIWLLVTGAVATVMALRLRSLAQEADGTTV